MPTEPRALAEERPIEPCPADLIELAERLADAARAEVAPHFRSNPAVEQKPDLTPVTAIDRAAEAAMRLLIADARPDHGIVGEEFGAEHPDADFVWVLDPIDGTKRFITGNPLFGTLIALLREGVPILGIIDMTVLDERWVGATGRRTVRRDAQGAHEVWVRPCAALSDAILSATSPHMFEGPDERAFERVRAGAKMVLYGGDCFNYGQLAEGLIDLTVEADMDPYDFLAQVPVIAGAGGLVTDWRGAPPGLQSDGRIVAAGDPRVHAEALALLTAD